MSSRFFRIIIPTRNGSKHLPRMVASIREQTCQDYHLIIADDMSEDETELISRGLDPDKYLRMTRRGLPGGTRNAAMAFFNDDAYTLWLDDDDRLTGPDVLAKIRQNAINNSMPDIIRLNFIKTRLSTGLPGNHHDRYRYPATPEAICKDIACGQPWAKAVRTERCVEFPDDLIIEDCFHHIMQCDVCETASILHDDCYEWLVREDSASQNSASVLWQSGWYLEVAKLMRQKEKYRNDWASAAADLRIRWIKQHKLKGG